MKISKKCFPKKLLGNEANKKRNKQSQQCDIILFKQLHYIEEYMYKTSGKQNHHMQVLYIIY